MKKDNIRVRFAPSPTGPLHIGGLRTALYNYLFAKKHNGVFILRIEDTDQSRSVPSAEDYIVDSLTWCGIDPDEGFGAGGDLGPYKQSERTDHYKGYCDQLIESGNAYYAFDTPEELEKCRENASVQKQTWQYDQSSRSQMRNSLTLSSEETAKLKENGTPYVVRIKIPVNEKVVVDDLIRGKVVVNTNVIDDKVIFKSDGMPTYHLANVVNDHLMEISHVIRGEEWLPSAPLHVLLYRFLGWEKQMPEFAHLPLLLKPDGNGKLSKRDGDRLGFPVFPLDWTNEDGSTSAGYRERGYFPEAVLNILAFLGWSPGTEKEMYSLEELVQDFSLEQVSKGGAKFNPEKAKWFNEQYLLRKPTKELVLILERLLAEKKIDVSSIPLARICELMKERVSFIHEVIEQGNYFFSSPAVYDEKAVKKRWKTNSPSIINGLISLFGSTADFTSQELETVFKEYVEVNEIGFGAAMISLRLVLTGVGGGPGVFDIMEVIGKEESLLRMRTGVERLSKTTTA